MTEFYARQDYIYDGDSRIFTIPFDSIEMRYIKVYINDVNCPYWQELNGSQVQIPDWVELTIGDVISIRRKTPINEQMVVFSDKSILNEESQNLAQKQLFYSMQELYDNNTQFKEDVEDALNNTSTELTNTVNSFKSDLETEITAGDDYLQEQFDNFEATVNLTAERLSMVEDGIVTAISRANQATQAAENANISANNAQTYAGKAQTFATQAESYAMAAGTSATLASETLSKVDTAGDNVLTSINSAKTNAITNINTAGTTQVSNVENAGANAISDVGTAKNNALSSINTKKNEALAEIEEAATPSDDAFQNYYTKSQVNTLLDGYYTKTQVDTTLGNYYTTTQIDNTLANYYTKSQTNTTFGNYYTKTQVDNIVGDIGNVLDSINGEVI